MAHPRRALVTGGKSGIGAAIAEALACEGCEVGVLDIEAPDAGRGDGRAAGGSRRRGWARRCDVSRPLEVREAVDAFLGEFQGLEILINNAGIFRDQVMWKMTDEQWQSVIDVDLTGAFNCSRCAVEPMRRGGWGAIVNITSINGLRGKFGQTNYSAAKAGVIGLTKAMARELAGFNVTVNAVAPGLIETPATAGLPGEAREQALHEILMGRLGTPGDVAGAVAFLCSERARFITGEVIRVDGGQYV